MPPSFIGQWDGCCLEAGDNVFVRKTSLTLAPTMSSAGNITVEQQAAGLMDYVTEVTKKSLPSFSDCQFIGRRVQYIVSY